MAATGIKEALVNAGIIFEKILNSPPSEISDILGIDSYVAKLIYDEARKTATNEENLSNPTQFNQFLSQKEIFWIILFHPFIFLWLKLSIGQG